MSAPMPLRFLVVMALVVATGGIVRAAQDIHWQTPWERELRVGMTLDQEHGGRETVSGHTICQVFTPATYRLVRLDITTKNRTDPAPGVIRLFEWQGDLEDTLAGAPLWQDALQFQGTDAPVLRQYFPDVPVEPGKQYMIECSRPGEWFYMAGSKQGTYQGGFVITEGKRRDTWDIWFRTFGPSDAAGLADLPQKRLPPIDEKRATPRGEPAAVSRETYLQIIRRHVERNRQGWEREGGRRVANLLYHTGFLYRQAGEDQWAPRVSHWLADGRAYFEQHADYGGHPFTVSQLGWGIRWFRANPHWTDRDADNARELFLRAMRLLWQTPERGAMNRAMWDVQCTGLAAELYPDAPEAGQWREFSRQVWQDWAEFDDTAEDSSHYNAVFLHFMLHHALLTGKLDLFSRPGMRRFMDRYRDVITPGGMMVGWGDSPGFGTDWGAFVAAFEAAATITGDGTYKWAAHALLDGHRRNILADEPLQQGYEDIHSIPLAYLLADDSVQPVVPELTSGVYTMAYPRYNDPTRRKANDLPYYQLEDRKVPWKMVMRDGAGEDAYYALMGLLPLAGHGHVDAPALLALSADGTLSMVDTAYFHKRWEDHNLLYGVRLSGGKLGSAPTQTRIEKFVDTDALCYADIAWEDHAGWGATFRREVLLIKGLGWWVRDRTQVTTPQTWYLGPLWHVERILDRGQNWFDVDYPVPMSFAWPSANGDGHLLVYFTPQRGAVVDYGDMSHRVDPERPWYSSHPWALYQCAGPVQLGPGQQAQFNSMLIPLLARENAPQVGNGVSVVLDEPGATVLRIPTGDTEWTVALNNDGRSINLMGKQTDAPVTIIKSRHGQIERHEIR